MENEPKGKLTPGADGEIDLDHELLEEAFELKADDRLQLEKKILAVAFLLEACSREGNESIDGAAASGFAAVLRQAAEDIARLRRQLRSD